MKFNHRKVSGFFKFAIILLVLLSQFGWAVGSASAVAGSISGTIYGPDGYPLTGVSVQVQAIRKADGTVAASTNTDPVDGTYTISPLLFNDGLAVVASNEDPDVDGYTARYFNSTADLDWAASLFLTAGTPSIFPVDITLNNRTAPDEHLTFNVRAGRLLEDLNLRKAVAYATDRQAIFDGAFVPAGYYGTIMNSLVFPGVWYEADETDPYLTVYTHSQSMAETYLGYSGWADNDGNGYKDKGGQELSLDFITTDASTRVAAADIFRLQMQSVGILVNVYTYPTSTFFSSDPAVSPLAAGNFDIAEFAWILDDLDYLMGIYRTGDGQNLGGYENTTLDGFWEAARVAKEADDPSAFYSNALEWQYEFSDNLPAFPMFARGLPSISGVVNGADGYPLTGVEVQVDVHLKSDDSTIATVSTDSADGTYFVSGLPLDTDLYICASMEDPDVDGYIGECYDNASGGDWGVTIVLTMDYPELGGVAITLNDHSSPYPIEQFTFNTIPERLLSDVLLRQAIAYGTDRQAILETIWEPAGITGEIMHVMLYPGEWFAAPSDDPSLTKYDYSPATASYLLASAGWLDSDADGILEKDGNDLALVFATSDRPERIASANLFKTQMIAIGIDISIVTYPDLDFLPAAEYDIAEFAWGWNFGYDELGSAWYTGDAQNFGGYSNLVLDAFLDEARSARRSNDTVTFASHALDWQYEFSSQLPVLPLFSRIAQPSISGVIYGPDSNPLTGVSVLVQALYISDGSQAASTYTNPDDGTYILTGLPLDQELAVVASGETPDVDGYEGKYYINASIDWAVGFVLTNSEPARGGVDIYLGSTSAPVEHFTFNTRPEWLLSDVTIRQAIAYGTDRQYLLENGWELNGMTGELVNTVILPGVWYEALADDPSLTVYNYNPTYAASLLAGAGWLDTDADGYLEKDEQELSLNLITVNTPARGATAGLFAIQMAAIGIRINLSLYDASIFFSTEPGVSPLYSGNFDIAEFAWIMSDYDYLIGVYNSTIEENYGQNYGGYVNLTLDDYFVAARGAKQVGDQDLFYDNALNWQYEFSADLPALPLFSRVLLPVIAGTILDSVGNPLTGVSVELVVLNLDETIYGTVDSNSDDGTYSFFVPENWSGSVTPSLSGYYFDPVSRPYANVTDDLSAEDYFAFPYYSLTITKTGTGAGWVGSSPGGISCGADCSESYAPGTSVKLTATASAGSAFTGWSGACGGMSTTCYVTMSKAKSVTANFTLNPAGQYFLSTVKVGSGSILSTPAGISCPTDCGEFYNSGTSVKLVATASAGYVFTGWSGACGGTTATCFVPMSKNKTVTATFLAVPAGKYYLGVKKAGTGTVTSVSPAGTINCGTDCSEFYNAATVVRLHATPALGSTFTGWSGACGGTADCFVNMSNHKFVKATFTVIPAFRGDTDPDAFLPGLLDLIAGDPLKIWRLLD